MDEIQYLKESIIKLKSENCYKNQKINYLNDYSNNQKIQQECQNNMENHQNAHFLEEKDKNIISPEFAISKIFKFNSE